MTPNRRFGLLPSVGRRMHRYRPHRPVISNSIPVIQAIEKEGRAGQTAVMTTDLFPALIPFICSGRVLEIELNQRPRAQGRVAFQALYEFLAEGTCPPLRHRLSPHIILASNLDLFLEDAAW